MKFLCQRCKTRYSIADERVRGKILKIRCKSCSEVITVREGMETAPERPAAARRKRAMTQAAPEPLSGASVSGPAAAAKPPPRPGTRTRQPRPSQNPALRGAFEQALAAAPGHAPPATLEPDWYLAENGVQSGPFSLARAKAKLRERGPAEELYCWSEGFESWLPVGKVSHFRGVFDPVPPPAASFGDDDATVVEPGLSDPVRALTHEPPPPREATPKPLFASTWAALAESQKNGSAGRSPDGDGSDPMGDLQLDIGEASRVVKLSMLSPKSSPTAAQGTGSLPGMVAQPGAQPQMPQAGAMMPAPTLTPMSPSPHRRRRAAAWLPFIAGGCVLVLVVSVLIYLVASGDGGGKERRARSDLADETLGYSFTREGLKSGQKERATPEDEGREEEVIKRDPRRSGSNGRQAHDPRPRPNDRTGKSEVDLSGSSRGALPDRVPSDITAEYRKNSFPIQHCHDIALKRNPFLDVRRARVDITVAPSGRVTAVEIPSLEGTVLGRCIETRIRAWRLEPAANELSTRLTLLFARR